MAQVDKEKIKAIHIGMLRERLAEIRDFVDSVGITKAEFQELLNEMYGGREDDK